MERGKGRLIMLRDNRLFSYNNPIGRKWYFLNLFLIACIAGAAYLISENAVLPQVNDDYRLPAQWFIYAAYLMILVTFLSLIYRRILDICGTKDAGGYRAVSGVIALNLIIYGLEILSRIVKFEMPDFFYVLLIISSGIFFVMVFLLGLFRGAPSEKR